MDLIAKYADKLPGKGEPGVFDQLIQDVELTKEYTEHEKIMEPYPDKAKPVNDIATKVLGYMKDSNRFSYFIKDDEKVTAAVEKGHEIIGELNSVLKRIINLNFCTKICMLSKLLRKFEELKQTFEQYKEEVEHFLEIAKRKVSRAIFNSETYLKPFLSSAKSFATTFKCFGIKFILLVLDLRLTRQPCFRCSK